MTTMKTLHFFALAILVLCNITAVCQSEPFVGEWQVGRNPKTKDTNITMTLVGSGKDLRGKMAFRNPDKTFTMAEIRNVSVKGATLEFETLDGGEPLHWSLA